LLLVALTGTALAAGSDAEIAWSLIARQVSQRLPGGIDLKLKDRALRINRLEGSSGSQSLDLELTLPVLSPQAPAPGGPKKNDFSADTPKSSARPRVGGADFEFVPKPPQGAVASLRPSKLQIAQAGKTQVVIPNLTLDTGDLEVDLSDVRVDVEGVQFSLDQAVELGIESKISSAGGIPVLTDAKPFVKMDPSKFTLNCSALKITLPVKVESLAATASTMNLARDQICRYIEMHRQELWDQHEAEVRDLLLGLEPQILNLTHQAIEQNVAATLRDAVGIAIHGLEITNDSLRFGIAPTGQDCAPLGPSGMHANDEFLARLSPEDLNQVAAHMLPKSMSIGDNLGSVAFSTAPKLIHRPGLPEGVFEIQFSGQFNPSLESGTFSALPMAKPPYSAAGSLQVRPTVKDGNLQLEVLKTMNVTISDSKGNRVDLEQDTQGGKIKVPNQTLESLMDDALQAYTRNTALMIFDGKSLRRDLKIITRKGGGQVIVSAKDSKKVFGKITQDGRVVSTSKALATGLKLVTTREIEFGGKKATLIGKPSLGIRANETQAQIDSTFLIDLKASEFPDKLEGISSLGEYVFDGTEDGAKQTLDHATIRIAGTLNLSTQGEAVRLSLDQISEFKITNADPNVTSGFWAGAAGVVDFLTFGWSDIVPGKLGSGESSGKQAISQLIPPLSVKKSEIPGLNKIKTMLGEDVDLGGIETVPGLQTVIPYSFKVDQAKAVAQGSARPRETLQTLTLGEELIPEPYRGWVVFKDAQIKNGRLEVRLSEGLKAQPAPILNSNKNPK